MKYNLCGGSVCCAKKIFKESGERTPFDGCEIKCAQKNFPQNCVENL